MLRLEKRPNPSKFWLYGTPVVAVVLTMVFGGLLFAVMGKNPLEVIRTIFWDPLFGEFAFYLRGQLLVKAGPLILIAIGLALGFKAGIWNIGAEGQYIMGAICGAAVGLAVLSDGKPAGSYPAMVIAGAFGGWAWAMIPAILKTRFNTNEILGQPHAGLCGADDPGQSLDRFSEEPRRHGLSGQPELLQLSGGGRTRTSSIPGSGLHWGGVDGAGGGGAGLYPAQPPYHGVSDPAGRASAPGGAVSWGEPGKAGGPVHGDFGRAGGLGRVV